MIKPFLILHGFKIKIIQLFVFIFIIAACKKDSTFSVNTFEVNNGWGYTIQKNEKIIIRQTVIPTVQKEMSFETKEEALKVGNLVLERISNNLPPTITKNDLIALNISIHERNFGK